MADLDVDALKERQRELAEDVIWEDDLPPIVDLAAFDVAYDGDVGYGALILADRDGNVDDVVVGSTEVDVPYVPGLLAFREFPVLEAAWKQIDVDPDLLIVDGGGAIHPRGLGFASHAGVVLDVPTVGVTKTLLLGEVDGTVRDVGDVAPIVYEGGRIGHAYHSCPRARNPIYVSPGHRVSADTALEVVQNLCSGSSRLPDVLQRADREAGKAKTA